MKKAVLPPLTFPVDALEPYYDAKTVQLHHGKHHQAYVNGFNAALEKLEAVRAAGDFAAVKHWTRELAFHGGGHILHSLFWANLKPGGGGEPHGDLATAIASQFGSLQAFDTQLRAVTNAVEGSGWGIVAAGPGREVAILQAEKHQNQLLPGWRPILAVDVWEHAYYLRYENRRAEFVDVVLDHLVNWREVERRFAEVAEV
ncbi:MAG TPA: superoxide dismutase [Thermoanaerobaculaceae bacterium]|nr:superoxide dismutase [Thermoanaerobaculaceae bacterium]